VSKRSKKGADQKPWKLLLWTAVAGLIFGLIGFGEIAEDDLRVVRNGFHQHKASGDLIVVKFDDQALRRFGNWPWPRSRQAALVNRLTDAGARGIFFDINFSYPSDAADDRAFAEAINRSRRTTLGVRLKIGTGKSTRASAPPLPLFAQGAKLAAISAQYNYQNAVWHLPYALQMGSSKIPSLAAAIAGVDGPVGVAFPVDYSIDVRSIPSISAGQVLDGHYDPRLFAGRRF
jgi:Predicted transmembrane sensor domain